MSDPFVHFGVGFLTGLVANRAIFDSTGNEVKNPYVVPVVAGIAAMAVDLDHLPRFIEAGWSYTRLVLEAQLFGEIYNYHFVSLALVAFFTFISFIFWQSAKANKLERNTSRAGWVFCSLATLTTVIITHLFMDFVFQCTIWPAARCGWVGG